MTEDQQEQLGEMVDTIRNLLAARNIPMSPQFHLDQWTAKLKELQGEIREMLVEDGAEDHWEGRDREIE